MPELIVKTTLILQPRAPIVAIPSLFREKSIPAVPFRKETVYSALITRAVLALGSAAEHGWSSSELAAGASPAFDTSQIYLLPNQSKQLFSEGLEGPSPTLRAVTGGTGSF